jgi:2-(1,2-epoxy-1,2-dihydrophenyl)acetyl-CoA isomerase
MSLSYDQVVENARSERELVRVERGGAHAIVTLDDPEKLNPLSAELTVELHDKLQTLSRDPAVRAIVLTGRDPAFSAGGDLRLMLDSAQSMLHSPGGATEIWRWIRNQFGGIARLITRTDKAYIAAVNGPAAGVGLAFALACDVIVLSERARIVPAFGRIGLVPEVGNSWALTRRLGYQRTFGLFASGRHLAADEAFALGLGNELVAHEQLLEAALAWCERIERLPAHVLTMTKPLLRQAADMTWEQAIAMEEFAEPMCFTTEAHARAVQELLNASGEHSHTSTDRDGREAQTPG